MSTLLISVPELQVTQLELRAQPEDWEGFTHIQVFRSQVGQDGPYEEISAAWWTGAVLPEDANVPDAILGRDYAVVGLTLELTVDLVNEYSITFTGTDPLTASACASQIDAAASPFVSAWVDTSGRLVLGSSRSGGQSSLAASGDAASVFGFTEGEVVFGKDPRPVLHSTRTSYIFRDYFSNSTYFYKTRFYNSGTGAVSSFSEILCTGSSENMPSSSLAVGYLRCVNNAGKVQKNVRAVVHIDPQLSAVQDRLVTGTPQEKLTDADGYVEFQLVRGLVATLVVPDMGLVRKITVPDADTFNMLESGLGTDDPFDVRRVSIAYGERRNF